MAMFLHFSFQKLYKLYLCELFIFTLVSFLFTLFLDGNKVGAIKATRVMVITGIVLGVVTLVLTIMVTFRQKMCRNLLLHYLTVGIELTSGMYIYNSACPIHK